MKRPREQGRIESDSVHAEWSTGPNEEAYYDCRLCGYEGQPAMRACTCADGPCENDSRQPDCQAGGPGCPVCLDGAVDPWSLIREIRALIRSSDAATRRERQRMDRSLLDHVLTEADREYRARLNGRAANVFQSEWELLRLSILSIWTDLSPRELTGIEGDRIRFEGMLKRRYGYGTALAHELTNGLQDLHERFNGKWDIVRECVPRHWPEVTWADVEHMSGTIGELAGLVERRYALERGRGRLEVIDFLHQIDYPLLLRLFPGDEPGDPTPPARAGDDPAWGKEESPGA